MTVNETIRWARSQIGVKESPAGSNRVPYWEDVLPEFQGSPWCGAFVWDALRRGGAELGWSNPRRFAYTPAGWADAVKAGIAHHGPPSVGDVVWYSFDGKPGPEHVGLVSYAGWWPRIVGSIEGNTSEAGSQSNGGQVLARNRSASLVVGFATPRYPVPTVVRKVDTGMLIVTVNADSKDHTVRNGQSWLVNGDGVRRYIARPEALSALWKAGIPSAGMSGDSLQELWPNVP